jgi:hypothetical protein
MSTGFNISRDEGLISVFVEADVELIGLDELAQAVLNDPDYDITLPLLVDLRGMHLELEKSTAEPFAEKMIGQFGDRQASAAVIVDPDMNTRLCAAIYWLASAIGNIELFDDYDHALKWLIRREFVNGELNQATPTQLANQVLATPAAIQPDR